MLRINSRYIGEKYRQRDLLTWFINYWFAQRPINEAYDPMSLLSMPDSSNGLPLWLDVDVRMTFHDFQDRGICSDPMPSGFIGLDDGGNIRAICYIAITESTGLMSEAGMRSQAFLVDCSDCSELIDAIANHQMFEDFKSYLDKRTPTVPIEEIAERLKWYSQNCEMMEAGVSTQSPVLRAAWQ